MTLDGTNTWVLREPGARRCVVVDPGPSIPSHIDAVIEAAGDVGLILVTHHHFDHTDALAELCERVGAPARALTTEWCVDAEPLVDAEEIDVDGLAIRVVATPGHTADSTSFVLPAERVLLTGDTVLGRGTSIVAHPDGQLGAYFASLDRMRAIVAAGEVETIWPAHGPVIDDALAVLDFYAAHRRERLEQVQSAVARLKAEPHPEGIAAAELPRRIVEIVYADVDTSLWDAAEWSVRAQLAYLAET